MQRRRPWRVWGRVELYIVIVEIRDLQGVSKRFWLLLLGLHLA